MPDVYGLTICCCLLHEEKIILPFIKHLPHVTGFPDGSVGKESACNAGDTGDRGSIPGSGRSPGEGNGDRKSVV